jgi:hypothetical protein
MNDPFETDSMRQQEFMTLKIKFRIVSYFSSPEK